VFSLKIYLDCCCYNRPFDDLLQDCVIYESNAILSIIKRATDDDSYKIMGSDILNKELNAIKNDFKKDEVLSLYESVSIFIPHSKEIEEFAAVIRNVSSIHFKDSLHLASAEIGKADIFLTTDYKLINACQRLNLNFKVLNPVTYIAEVFTNA